MTASDKRNVTLSAEQAAYVEELVASGAYVSANDVVRAGLNALRERDATSINSCGSRLPRFTTP